MEINEKNLVKYAGWMLCVLALASANHYCRLPISNTLFYYVGAFSLIGISIYLLFRNEYYRIPVYGFVIAYLIYDLFTVVLGVKEVNSYWVFNQFIRGTIGVMVPVSIFLFATPRNCIPMLRLLNCFIAIVSIFFLGWALSLEGYAFLLIPFYCLYLCFMKDMPKKWRWLTVFFLVLIIINTDNRSGIIKTAFTLLVLGVSVFPKLLEKILLHISHLVLYALPVWFLYLGWTGQFNVLNPLSTDTVTIRITNDPEGENEGAMKLEEQYTIDTRTFIYIEMLESAIENNYIVFGNTPARGYHSSRFGAYVANNVEGIDFDERFESEIGLMNTFTRQGVVGVILLSMLYLCGTIMALFFSRNMYVKRIAVLVAFHWAYGWIENNYHFYMMDLTIFVMLGFCYSPWFRNMSDSEFRLFIRDIFAKPSSPSVFANLQSLKLLIVLSALRNRIPKVKPLKTVSKMTSSVQLPLLV